VKCFYDRELMTLMDRCSETNFVLAFHHMAIKANKTPDKITTMKLTARKT